MPPENPREPWSNPLHLVSTAFVRSRSKKSTASSIEIVTGAARSRVLIRSTDTPASVIFPAWPGGKELASRPAVQSIFLHVATAATSELSA